MKDHPLINFLCLVGSLNSTLPVFLIALCSDVLPEEADVKQPLPDSCVFSLSISDPRI